MIVPVETSALDWYSSQTGTENTQTDRQTY